jgi:hypothetical protein
LTSGWIARGLDALMLGEAISGEWTADEELAERSGDEVAQELGGRMLLRYVEDSTEKSRSRATFVSPTAYSADEVGAYLALPNPESPRRHVLFLNPSCIERIKGPRWVMQGQGIEYILVDGYDETAIVGNPWPVRVR